MNVSDLMREGPIPAIAPNAGQRRSVCWTRADAGRFGELLKKRFPEILFYEESPYSEVVPEKPAIKFFERLDDPAIRKPIVAFLPFPGWKPDLVKIPSRIHPHMERWVWANYLSPIISIETNSRNLAFHSDWRGGAKNSPLEYWHGSDIATSYRRQIRDEARIQSSVLALLKSICIRAVPIRWNSYDDFLARRGGVALVGIRTGMGWVTSSVIEWSKSDPRRAIQLEVTGPGVAYSCLPVEDVPDSWWGDIPKPKWAQRR